MNDQLKTIKKKFTAHKLNKARVCFEQAVWNSSDGHVKTYFHIHVQHDQLPDLNIGIGDAIFAKLLVKIETQLIPELKAELYGKR